jgi:hypothetical protein
MAVAGCKQVSEALAHALAVLTIVTALLAASTAITATAAAADLAAAPTAAALPAAAPRLTGTTEQVDFFDPHRHMLLSEVRPGMTGYGLSVFHGTTRERFEVQVISILHNYNPKGDVVLIRCHGANLEHTGAIAGMSGSPVYLRDDSGRYRLIGAFAYGWPLNKDPMAGVQPIQYMLRIPADPLAPASPTKNDDAGSNDGARSNESEAAGSWSLWQLVPFPGSRAMPASWPLAAADRPAASPSASQQLLADPTGLQPLMTPLSAAGLPRRVIDEFAPLFRAQDLELLAGGNSGAGATMAGDETGDSAAATSGQSPPMQPGDSLVTPLLTGDAEASALGTCTEVIGKRVWAFGHPFNSEGNVDLPFGSGLVSGIVPELTQSFKLGELGRVLGTLRSDRTFGIAGTLGPLPPVVPIDVRILWTDGSEDQTYHFQCVAHPRFTPLLAVLATAAAMTGSRDLPQYHTLHYQLHLEFADGRVIDEQNDDVSAGGLGVLIDLLTPITAASDNPFGRVMIRKISATISVIPQQREAEVLSVNVPRLNVKPGETVQAYVAYRPFHEPETTRIIYLPLPKDLPDGTYQLVVSGWQRYLTDEAQVEPFKFTAQNLDDVFGLLKDLASIQHSAIYARVLRQADGVAIGRTALPRLPSSQREVLLDAGRSDTTAYASSVTSQTPMDRVMDGAAEFTLTVDSQGRGETGMARPGRPEPLLPTVPAAQNPAPEQPALPGQPTPPTPAPPGSPGG